MKRVVLISGDIEDTLAVVKGNKIVKCPTGIKPPEPLCIIAYASTEEKVLKIKQGTVNHYVTSTYNTCMRQPKPLVESLPLLRLLVDPTVVPKAVFKSMQILGHLRAKVVVGLEEDIRLSVIERVPENTPSTWCSGMSVVVKKNGSPR